MTMLKTAARETATKAIRLFFLEGGVCDLFGGYLHLPFQLDSDFKFTFTGNVRK